MERVIIITAFLVTMLFYAGLIWLCRWASRSPWTQPEAEVGAQWFEGQEPPKVDLMLPTRNGRGEVWYNAEITKRAGGR